MIKRVSIATVLFTLTISSVLWFCNTIIQKAAEGKTYDRISFTPNFKVGLLLGTSKTLKNGHQNLYFNNRINAATSLFKAGKIQYLIISGDNGHSDYDEPTDMKNELIKNGIDSTKLYLDYAGFRTFDSIKRAKEIFGQSEILIISQKFHNERAIYISNRLSINASGFNASDVSNYYGFKTSIREKFARVKVIIDFLIGTQPKFLGDKIHIK